NRRSSAIGAAVARFPDTEEVTGSIPVSRTTWKAPAPRAGAFVVPGHGTARRAPCPRRSVACGAGPGAPGPPRAPGRGEGEATSSVTQPRLAEQTEYGRMYARSVADQATVPSITTVL